MGLRALSLAGFLQSVRTPSKDNTINLNEKELLTELRKFREKVENSFVDN